MATLLGVNFDPAVLTASIRKLDSEANDRMFTELFRAGRKLDVGPGNKFVWQAATHSRGLSPARQALSKAATRQGMSRSVQSADLLISKQKRTIPWTSIFPGGTRVSPEREQDLVRAELKDMVLEIGKFREYVLSQMLTGSCLINDTTVPGSDVNLSYPFPVSTLSSGASWATAGTKILSTELRAMQDKLEDTAAVSVERILINNKTHSYLISNTEAAAFAANSGFAEYFLSAKNSDREVLKGLRLGGVEWAANPHGYKLTSGGSLTKWIADDYAICLPNVPLEDVLGFVDAPFPMPTGTTYGSAEAPPLELANQGDGIVVWSKVEDDPEGVVLHARYMFGAAVLWPESVLYYHTAP